MSQSDHTNPLPRLDRRHVTRRRRALERNVRRFEALLPELTCEWGCTDLSDRDLAALTGVPLAVVRHALRVGTYTRATDGLISTGSVSDEVATFLGTMP